MTLLELYKAYGENWSQVQRELGLGKNTVDSWRKRGSIPYDTQCVIQVKTNGKFIAKESDDHLHKSKS